MTIGRFAPSPTGPLHLGSLVAAVGSWLAARAAGGKWLVRIEDLDTPRVVPGSEKEILDALERYGLEWDGGIVRQSERIALYDEALTKLRGAGLVYDCACSRSELQRAASAPSGAEPAYPGTCRLGIAARRSARAIRFRVPEDPIAFTDAVFGRIEERVSDQTGDFIVRRADGPYAYQLAVVVDDAEQGITQVARGADLLTSTARQIALQRALGLATPEYLHLPLVVAESGSKISKRDGALPLPSLSETRVRQTLRLALRVLGVDVDLGSPEEMLRQAVGCFDPAAIPSRTVSIRLFGETPSPND
ncbi:MAG TPA: tRNA glutamyl-Q(34) synthetase GluQRS [Thermoanaerobaculia bacterium]|nr:tRNA glutamyl-Q(34) synthetase GluQRS [Thermoanaerobaculia bacterium]